MVDALGWVVAGVVGILAIVSQCVIRKREKLKKRPTAPPEQVATVHARAAIEDAAQRNLDTIDDALKSEDAADELAALANRASERRSK